MTDLGSHDEVISEWHKAFKRATDFDLWGQPVEASDGYHRYKNSLKNPCFWLPFLVFDYIHVICH